MQSRLIDLEGVSTDTLLKIQHLIEKEREAETRSDAWRDVLDNGTEADMMAFAIKKEGFDPDTPYISVQAYKGENIPRDREIVPYEYQDHPRRIVIIRSARYLRYHKYGLSRSLSPNGWALQVFKRVVRRDKKTFFKQEDWETYARQIADRIASAHRVTGVFYNYAVKSEFCFRHEGAKVTAMVGGRTIWLTPSEHQNIDRLYKIIKKTEELEKRLAYARESSRLNIPDRDSGRDTEYYAERAKRRKQRKMKG